ncbi:MAG: phosphate ABC transporter permease subunit PstC [Candidatus Methanospirare jalkutatii]|nr:MAG: phosphate ABC transporter permease subunit PstC [Candidatus Methanospirare jalkutatii]
MSGKRKAGGGAGMCFAMSWSMERVVESILLISALSSALIVFFIVLFMLKEGFPALMLGKDFFLGMEWKPSHDKFGILPTVISTLIVGVGALAISAAIGIPAAIYLAEFSPPFLRNVLKACVEMLVGVPSVVLGFFGLMVVVVFIRDFFGGGGGGGGGGSGGGECILAAWFILAIMTLPHVVSISEDAIQAVPRSLREASLALGATHWQTVREVVLPNARSGILASLILGMGNAIGETMAVLMVIGNPNIPSVPTSVFDAARVLTSTIVLEISYAVWGSTHQHALFALGIVLFAIVAFLNILTTAIVRREVRKKSV